MHNLRHSYPKNRIKMKRRQFISGSAASILTAAYLPGCIGQKENEKGYYYQGRTPGYLEQCIIDPGLKITMIETFSTPEVALVKVTTDSGAEGWGQISTYNSDIAVTVLHRNLAGMVLGRDPADIDAIVDDCVESNHKYPWSYVCRALGGIDTAIWDLYGKIKGKPVCELIGGRADPVRIYASSMSRTIKAEDEVTRFRKLEDEKGVTAFKFRIGETNGRNGDAWPGRTEDIIKTVGSAMSGSSLLVDGNSCYTPDKAIAVGKLLQDNGIIQFEEPCPYWELEWTAEVTAALSLDVSGGEQDNDLAQWRRMIAMKAVDITQPDILYIGGIARTMRVAKMAEQAGLPCIPHSANNCMVTLFTLHMMRAIPNAGKYLEYSIESDSGIEQTARKLFSPALEIDDGHLNLPPEPGWGVQVNSEWMESAEYQKSEWKG